MRRKAKQTLMHRRAAVREKRKRNNENHRRQQQEEPLNTWQRVIGPTRNAARVGLLIVRPTDQNVIPETGALFGKQVQIAASNLDQFLHTNWSNYLKFCYDAFVEYEVKKLGQENILNSFRKVKQFSLLFLQESSLMDTLDVHLWKDQENPDLFKF
ncbi:hypothetical protein ElyMa_003748900 [Elysia marginata]|uniref:Uncharacterized protein n=1 Tax=Elysia marginata TaxID=1093978 RepID=A0AAV4F793_9GAST|nr:hypothetical protein ElyMa_003748900 [Elysia marginata]